MMGKISKYDKINEIGYILGYDELTYFYHQNNVIKHEELKEDDIVSFDYILEKSPNELPYAINIVKEEYKVEHIQDFENQETLAETRSMLAVVYRDYLATEEEKQETYQKTLQSLKKKPKIQLEKKSIKEATMQVFVESKKIPKNLDKSEKIY